MLGRAVLGLALLVPSLWAAKTFPPAPRSYVYNEGVVSMEAASALGQNLRALEEKTGHQFVVALFQSLDGESLEDYSNRLFRAWGIGDAKKNDGLLFALFFKDRKWRVEVGYGLEGTVTDLEAGAIARDQGVPYFKRNDYDRGVAAVVWALSAKLGGWAQEGRPWRREERGGDFNPARFWIMFLMLPIIILMRLGADRPVTFGRRSGWDWGGGSGGFGGGGFSGGGGSSGGGGASGGW